LLSSAEGTTWTEENVCPQGGGVRVTAAQTGGTQTHQFQVLCGSEANFGRPEIGNSKHQKKKKQQQEKQNVRRRAAKKKRRKRRPAQLG
jgi:hypothetical protein